MFAHFRKHKNIRRQLALLMSLALVLSNLSMGQVLAEESAGIGSQTTVTPGDNETSGGDSTVSGGNGVPGGDVYVLDAGDLELKAQGELADGEEISAGTDNYFTVLGSAKTKIEVNSKTFSDNVTVTRRLNPGSKVSTTKDAVKFTSSAAADVKIYWGCGDVDRQMAILDSTGNQVAVTAEAAEKNALYVSTLSLEEAGTYYIGGIPGKNYIHRIEVTEHKPVTTVYSFDATTISADGVADKAVIAEGTTFADGYFKIAGTVNQRISSTSGKTTSVEVAKAAGGSIQFTVTGTANVVVTMSSTGGSNTSAVGLADGTGAVLANKEGITVVTGTSKATLTYEGLTAGTYSVISPEDASNNRGARVYTIEVTETTGGVRPPRADWGTVSGPDIIDVAVNASSIDVTVKMAVGYDGADKVTVIMTDEQDNKTDEKITTADGEAVVNFTPESSGIYSFQAVAARDGEEDKVSEKVTAAERFILPLTAPNVVSATSKGGGKVQVKWNSVKEAEKYIITVDGTDISAETANLVYVVEGLTIGQTYTFYVKAVRGSDVSEAGSISCTVTADEQREWAFSAFGDGISLDYNGYRGSAADGSVDVYSNNGKGKLVPASRDGLAFYYTELDADKDNFILSATVKVNNWKFSNGQEGFGLMAADAVGTSGDATSFWNNSYMASVTKVEYFWDSANNAVSDSGDKISMKLGVGAQEKIGATGPDTDVSAFRSTMATLETTFASYGTGTYNLVGGYTNPAPLTTPEENITEFKLVLKRDNTGYRLSYTNAEGETMTKTYYDLERDNLNVIDAEKIYVGFFASRNADINFSDINLIVTDSAEDAPPEDVEITYITPSYNITSAATANTENYNLVFRGNADGKVSITAQDGTVVAAEETVTANQELVKSVVLNQGDNTFTVTMVPDRDYVPAQYTLMADYEPRTFIFTVNYDRIIANNIYVAPEGTAAGDGTKENPVDIYTAVKYAAPGQVIVLEGATYHLDKTIKIERGIDGTANNPITLTTEPGSAQRAVFDFDGNCAGMILAGNYWYLKDFDVTNSANAQKGIQVSGSYNTLDRVDAYHNGNTGIQISRYLSTDEPEKWPSYNLILNCTSYGNADRGYEDADGFAAKLTVGEGNVFDGCIAHHNADDGWDLFAKIETGPIGKVVIRNSVAYSNGVLEDGTDAGNGNGFKLGGSAITGYHMLINSVAFDNKAKGIDSNSCPDIQVQNCTTFNNGSYNVAFYTSGGANTDFSAQGLLSFRTEHLDVREQISLKNQDTAKVYGSDNYYWDAERGISSNADGEQVEESWFVSLSNPAITRNVDGTINMNGYLELTADAPQETGARMSGSASGSVTIRTPEQVIVDHIAGLENLSAEDAGEIANALVLQHRQDAQVLLNRLSELNRLEAQFLEILGITLNREVAGSIDVDVTNLVYSLRSGQAGTLVVRNGQVSNVLPESLSGRRLANAVAFELQLMCGGSEISLQVPVVLRFALPAGISTDNLVMLHYMDNGTVETLPVEVRDGYVMTVTSGFSTFVLANTEEAGGNGSGDNGNGDNGNGGNGNNTNDNNADNSSNESSEVQTGNSGSDRKSPATYDNSIFVPDMTELHFEGMKAENAERNGWWLALAALAAGVAGAAASFVAYRKARKED